MGYRTDIDGLRAIAVVSVILFHFGFSAFGGGYVGVDIFFVISGYLIGSMIFSQLDKHSFSFSTFYFRRIRRLFPVYVVVMVTTYLFCYRWMLPNDFREFGQSFFASTVYASNFLFFRDAGYFDSASHLKPLLHTWSLSVEEQFYVVFPVLAWAVFKYFRRQATLVFILLSLLSFFSAAWYINRDASAVFYLYPFRAWEMFIGVILGLNVFKSPENRTVRNALSFVGLFLVIFPCFYYTQATLFPGIAALAPCVGTALLISAGTHGAGWVQTLLSTKPFVFVGKISYSLYLWHWPIFVLYTYALPRDLLFLDSAAIVALTLAASVITWRLVEIPFREGKLGLSKTKKGVFTATLATSSIFLVVGYYVHTTDGQPNRFSPQEQGLAQAAEGLFGSFEGCVDYNNPALPGISHCAIGEPFTSSKYLLVWGDSHAGAYMQTIRELADSHNSNVVIAWAGGCPPTLGLSKDENFSSAAEDERCLAHNNAVAHLIQSDSHRISAIVLIGRWSYYLKGEGLGDGAHNKISLLKPDGSVIKPQNQAEYFTSYFQDTIVELNRFKTPLFIVEQVPEFSDFNARKLAISLINGSKSLDQISTEYGTTTYQNVIQRQGEIFPVFDKVESNRFATMIRTHQYFCNDNNCSLMINGTPAYFDNNHISTSGAASIEQMFDPVIPYLKP